MTTTARTCNVCGDANSPLDEIGGADYCPHCQGRFARLSGKMTRNESWEKAIQLTKQAELSRHNGEPEAVWVGLLRQARDIYRKAGFGGMAQWCERFIG